MRSEDLVRIQHMIEASENAVAFVSGRNRSDLDTDRMLLFAVVRAIEIMGEAASKITDETRVAQPAVPWHAMVGMRNRLVHAYFEINAQMVWETVTVEIPSLLPTLKALAGAK